MKQQSDVNRRLGSSWSVDEDVDWSKLTFDTIAPAVRGAMAAAYGHILLAEELGLRVVQRLVEAAPEGTLRDLARAHVRDEQRHIAFFSRVAAGLGTREATSPSLVELENELANLRSYTSIMAFAQVMENAANVLFNGHARQSQKLLSRAMRLPGFAAIETLLMTLTHLVGRDEGMHVAAGARILRASFAELTMCERHILEEQVQTTSSLMLSACAEVAASYRCLGFNEHTVLERITLAQERYWRHLDIDASARQSFGWSTDV